MFIYYHPQWDVMFIYYHPQWDVMFIYYHPQWDVIFIYCHPQLDVIFTYCHPQWDVIFIYYYAQWDVIYWCAGKLLARQILTSCWDPVLDVLATCLSSRSVIGVTNSFAVMIGTEGAKEEAHRKKEALCKCLDGLQIAAKLCCSLGRFFSLIYFKILRCIHTCIWSIIINNNRKKQNMYTL